MTSERLAKYRKEIAQSRRMTPVVWVVTVLLTLHAGWSLYQITSVAAASGMGMRQAFALWVLAERPPLDRTFGAGEMAIVVRFGSAFAELALCALLWICFLALHKTTRAQRELLVHIDELEAQHGDKCCAGSEP